jgi:phage terminase large subunit GpA-like protein
MPRWLVGPTTRVSSPTMAHIRSLPGTGIFTKAQTESWAQLSRQYFEVNPNEAHLAEHQGRRIKAPFESKIHFALEQLTQRLLARKFVRDDGVEMTTSRLGIDANWGKTTDLVKRFCRYAGDRRLTPMHGRFVGATTRPFDEWQRREGWLFEDQVHSGIEKVSWVIPAVATGIRHVLVDTNHYKTFLHHRLAAPLATPGSIVLFQANPKDHEMFAQHLGGSERPEPVTAKGRTIDEWKELPSRYDNDFLDCMVGCLCLASIEGACLKALGKTTYRPNKTKRRSLSEMWRKKRAV